MESGVPAHMAEWKPWKRIISNRLLQALLERFPLGGEADLRFLLSVVMTMHQEEPDQRIVFPREAVAACIGLPIDRCRGKDAAGKRLDDFIERVLPAAERVIYKYLIGEANSIAGVHEAVSEEIISLRDQEWKAGITGRRWVYPAWSEDEREMTPTRKTRKRKEYVRGLTTLMEENDHVNCQRKLLNYLSSHHGNSFVIKNREERYQAARGVLDEYPAGTEEEKRAKRKLSRDLRGVVIDPFPLYRPATDENGSVRLVPRPPSLATIPKKMRRTLQPDWIEMDLSQAHLAIAAGEWGLDEVTERLEASHEGGERSIWRDLHRHTECERHGIPQSKAKRGFKSALYALLYGAAPANIYKAVKDSYAEKSDLDDPDLPDSVLKRFGSHSVIKRLYVGREKRIKEMGEAEVAEDIFGRELHYDPDSHEEIRSVLSKLAQSIELKLLEPVVDAVVEESERDHPRFKVLLWQHDGFSFRPAQSRDEELWIRRLKKRVDEANTKYPTRLEVDFPPRLAD